MSNILKATLPSFVLAAVSFSTPAKAEVAEAPKCPVAQADQSSPAEVLSGVVFETLDTIAHDNEGYAESYTLNMPLGLFATMATCHAHRESKDKSEKVKIRFGDHSVAVTSVTSLYSAFSLVAQNMIGIPPDHWKHGRVADVSLNIDGQEFQLTCQGIDLPEPAPTSFQIVCRSKQNPELP